MFKPEIGECTKCNKKTEVWPEYKWQCADCFKDEVPPSKYMIGDIPLVRVVEDLLMERPIIKKIMDMAMVEAGVHRILRLESDGHIYPAETSKSEFSNAYYATAGGKPPEKHGERESVNVADPELIPKLNKMIDKHLETCDFCQNVIESEDK